MLSAGLLALNMLLLSRVDGFAWARFFAVAKWSLLAYVVIAGLIEYAFLHNHLRGGPLVVLTLSLVVFAVHVPIADRLHGRPLLRPRTGRCRSHAGLSRRRYAGRVWPPEALEFLRELEDNNDRDWFRANRQRYDEQLRDSDPRDSREQLATSASPTSSGPTTTFASGLDRRSRSTSRSRSAGDRAASTSHLSLDGLIVAAGLHRPARDQLERFRAAIDDGRRAKGFERAVNTAESAGLSLASSPSSSEPRAATPWTIRASITCG